MLSFQTKREKREAVIRSSLIERLKDSVQSLIYGPGGENVPRLSANSLKGQVLGHTDNTNALCSVLEAIFIHGLKDSLGERLSSMFLGDLDRMPVPNFWLVVMIISHRDLIEQVSSLSFIMSDVGKGRAWLRLALNQGQLISYLSVLASDWDTLKDYYRPMAFLRDVESCDIMLRILQPLTGISFNLATNAAILNTWTQTPLILSGTWVPAKYERSLEPVLSATDVASTFLDGECAEGSGMTIPQTPLSDLMFDLILGSTPETRFILNGVGGGGEVQVDFEPHPPRKEETRFSSSERIKPLSLPPTLSLIYPPPRPFPDLPSSAMPSETEQHEVEQKSQKRSVAEGGLGQQPRRRLSSGAVSTSESALNRSISLASDTNEYRNLLCDWEASEMPTDNLPDFLTANLSSARHSPTENDPLLQQTHREVPEEEKDFEFLSSKFPSEEEMSSFLQMLTVLMNERGLDYQNYHCNSANCSVPVGMIYGKPRVCKYDGRYYCYECHQGDMSVIPSRVIHNWDFTPYLVCAANKKWLDTVMQHPLLDIRLVNPKLYQHIEDLSELQMLRLQLHFIQAYLFTCSSDRGQELRRMFWPREYLYEHVHLYSAHDLKQVYEGKLVPLARQAVTSGRQHILKCQVCSPRGFICEVCKDARIIYPFQLGDTFTCGSCCGVFHKTCVTRQSDCPRCKRLSSRPKGATSAANSGLQNFCDI